MARPSKARYVLLDRDGVINIYRPNDYVNTVAQFKFIRGARPAIRHLTRAGYRIVVVSNQAGVGKGYMTTTALDEITRHMIREVRKGGGAIADVLYCTHTPNDGCRCRKPRPGLLLKVARKHRLRLANTFFIGDGLSDVEAARSAGCRSGIVLTGKSTAAEVACWKIRPDLIARDLPAAARAILRIEAVRRGRK